MSLYIHKENVLQLFLNAGVVAGSALLMRTGDQLLDRLGGLGGVLLCSLGFVLTIVRMWKDRHEEEYETNVYKRIRLEIGEQELTFPRGYYFRQSSIYKTRRIPANIITEINPEQWPPACVINDNEVIFLKDELKEELIAFANRNGIPLVDREDLWGYICEPFLDTSGTEEEDQYYLNKLAEGGVPREEALAIRKKVKWAMLGLTYVTWEWLHYGHQNVLMSIVRTKKKYWWTMDVALRNYKKDKEKMPA